MSAHDRALTQMFLRPIFPRIQNHECSNILESEAGRPHNVQETAFVITETTPTPLPWIRGNGADIVGEVSGSRQVDYRDTVPVNDYGWCWCWKSRCQVTKKESILPVEGRPVRTIEERPTRNYALRRSYSRFGHVKEASSFCRCSWRFSCW